MVDAGEVDTVIIAKLDRLTRSVKDLAELLERFTRRGVSLVSVADSLDTRSAAGRLVLNIMVSVSQWEREAIAERTRDAMQHKIRQNEWIGNAAYGHRRCHDGRHVEPDAAEQKTLARIRRLREDGTSLRRIAERLNTDGVRTRSGGQWRHEYVARILK